MCGIVGVVRRSTSVPPSEIDAMARAQQHRGPDGYGLGRANDGHLALGMNLLSVVEEDTPPGPYRLARGGVMLTFAGEIYNWRELAARWGFPVLAQESDAHLLLRAWTRFGSSCLEDLEGMFAFALHDAGAEELVVVRDRFGEKPVYLRVTADALHLASEVKAIGAVVPLEPRFPDGWLSIETPVGTETPYADVELVRPGTLVRINLRSWEREDRTWWDIGDAECRESAGEGALADQFDSLLTRAVEMRRGERTEALMLSGGLDSAVLARLLRPEVLITVRYPGHTRYDEIDNARLVARSIGGELIVVEPTEHDLVDNIDAIVAALDYPVGNASILSEFVLYERLAQLGVKVVHGGVGPDEFLLGYVRHSLAVDATGAGAGGALGAYRPLAEKFKRGAPGSRSTAERYYRGILRGGDSSGAVHQLVHEQFAVASDVAQALTRVDLATAFPPLLLCADKLSSHFGLERRSPFLGHRWAEFCYALPFHAKYAGAPGARTKDLLRRYARSVGVPKQVVDDDDKRGFASPVPVWLTTTLRAWADQRIIGERAAVPTTPFDRTRFMDLMLSIWAEQAAPLGGPDASPSGNTWTGRNRRHDRFS